MGRSYMAGYAGIIGNALMPLNDNQLFSKRYARCRRRFVIDSPHWSAAALITVDHGRISVDGVAKGPMDEFRRIINDADAYLKMSTYDFLAFAMKRLTMAGLLRQWLTRNMTMKRPWRLLTLYRIYGLIDS